MHLPAGMATIVLLVCSFPGLAQGQNSNDSRGQLTSDTTFGTVRHLLLGRRVIVTGTVVDFRGSVLVQWKAAGRKGTGRYMATALDTLSARYKGTSAKVVAVQLHGLERRVFSPNILGKVVSDDDIVNPYCDVVVQFDDGTLAIWAGYPLSIHNNIDFAFAASAL